MSPLPDLGSACDGEETHFVKLIVAGLVTVLTLSVFAAPLVAQAQPAGSGFVASLARPGGNVTGLTIMGPDLVSKRLELLKEVIPKVSRVAVLRNPGNPASAAMLREAEATARTLGVQLQILEARSAQEIGSAFAAMIRERTGAFLNLPDGLFFTQRRQIAELAVKGRLPSISGGSDYPNAGGLMGYGPKTSLSSSRRSSIWSSISEPRRRSG